MNDEFGANGSRGGGDCRDVWSIIRQAPSGCAPHRKFTVDAGDGHLIALPRASFCAPGDKSRLARTDIS
jgi:hypothetical protein